MIIVFGTSIGRKILDPAKAIIARMKRASAKIAAVTQQIQSV